MWCVPAFAEAYVGEALVDAGSRGRTGSTRGTAGRRQPWPGRRLATVRRGSAFRDAARDAMELAAEGPGGALEAAGGRAAGRRRVQGTDEGRPERGARSVPRRSRPARGRVPGAVRRLELIQAAGAPAERDYVDWVLLGVSALLRDSHGSSGGGTRPAQPRLAGEAGGAASPSSERRAAWPPSRRRAPPSPTTSTSTPAWCSSGRSSLGDVAA